VFLDAAGNGKQLGTPSDGRRTHGSKPSSWKAGSMPSCQNTWFGNVIRPLTRRWRTH